MLDALTYVFKLIMKDKYLYNSKDDDHYIELSYMKMKFCTLLFDNKIK